MAKIRRALLSVFDKTDLERLGRGLMERGIQILSSGGTAAYLTERQIPVTSISEYTGSAEILDGRVKTLHPKIFGGILARDTPEHSSQLKEHGIDPIDLVVVNLYPFEATARRQGASSSEIIEMIDIGGPSLIRAAAKNHERTVVVVDPADYDPLLEALERGEGEVERGLAARFAGKAFARTAAYDAAISAHFSDLAGEEFPPEMTLSLRRVQNLRYGENPHQKAALYRNLQQEVHPALVDCEQLQGKELSYNNILDADAALNLVGDMEGTAVCIIKHTNPCGAASTAEDAAEAFRRARATDPLSAFGSIVVCNSTVDEELARELKTLFVEAVVAPEYDDAARKLLARRKKLRLLRYSGEILRKRDFYMRTVSGGLLFQEADRALEDAREARVVSRRAPTTAELRGLDFAWRICKHVKSNAIVFARDGQLVGVGAGQMSRVDSVKLAATKAQLPLEGSVLASDAFFPFRDGLDAAFEAGATAVIEPGGSIRDEEVIAAADEHDMALLFTGARHFRH